MAIKQIKSVAQIPSHELDDWGPVELPISDLVSQLRGRIIQARIIVIRCARRT